jgi:hypothetical protein
MQRTVCEDLFLIIFHKFFSSFLAPSHSTQLLEMTNSLTENFTTTENIMTQSLDPTILSCNNASVMQPNHDVNNYNKQQHNRNMTNFYNNGKTSQDGCTLNVFEEQISKAWIRRTNFAKLFFSQCNVFYFFFLFFFNENYYF